MSSVSFSTSRLSRSTSHCVSLSKSIIMHLHVQCASREVLHRSRGRNVGNLAPRYSLEPMKSCRSASRALQDDRQHSTRASLNPERCCDSEPSCSGFTFPLPERNNLTRHLPLALSASALFWPASALSASAADITLDRLLPLGSLGSLGVLHAQLVLLDTLQASFPSLDFDFNIFSFADFLLKNPVAALAFAGAAYYLIPRITKAAIRLVAIPLAVACLVYLALQDPDAALGAARGIVECMPTHPIRTPDTASV